ncbi:toll-like receptor 4 [Aplysia californica]|uniref:Toll-like receptor 4 n=1 Tax=Aplysia californica TaxID=6500 RepID=A0ABM0JM54_APLCA|nr:toll-like receptor 4 [Aplysia californica]
MKTGPKVVIFLGLAVLWKDFVQTASLPTAAEAENDAWTNKAFTSHQYDWEKESSLTPRAMPGGEYRRDPDDPEISSKQTSGTYRRFRGNGIVDMSQQLTSYDSSSEGNDDPSLAWEYESLLDRDASTHLGAYNCSVSTYCVCHRVEHGLHIYANCSSLRLHHIPQDLPKNIRHLKLAKNRLRCLNLSVLLEYPGLASVDAQENKLTSVVEPSSLTASPSLLVLLLGKNHFRSIGENAFRILTSLERLSLNHNKIQSLTNFTFSGLDKLYILDLSWNDIQYIELGTFDSVPKLSTLLLNNNPKFSYYQSHMAPRVFLNLKSLRVLNIVGNSALSQVYPNDALGYLTSLHELNMDGLARGVALGPQVKNLKHLKSLKIGVGENVLCNIRNLTSSFFENTPYLASLNIQHCLMAQIDSDAFVNMSKLQSLKISYSRNLGVSEALRSLSSLQNSSLKSLELVHLVSHGGYPCRYITEEDSVFIKNMRLELLDLSDNFLAMIEGNFYEALPKTLKTLILRNNKFSLATFDISYLASLKNLTKVDLTSQNIGRVRTPPPKSQKNKDGEACRFIPSDNMDSETYPNGLMNEYEYPATSKTPVHTELPNENQTRNLSAVGDRIDAEEKTPEANNEDGCTTLPTNIVKKIVLPPNLQILWTPQFILYGEIVLYQRVEAGLKEIDFSHSFLSEWGEGMLQRSARNVSLEGNYCKYIREDFFPDNNSLKLLNIRNNILGPQFANDEQGKVFKQLVRVRRLDLSMNLIYRLPPNFFNGLKSLNELMLSDNKLQSLNFSVSSMPHLKVIDASKNSISWIGRTTRDGLDSIALHHPVSLDLRKNPLPCTCKGIEILSWLATTNVLLTGEDFLVCRFETNDYVTIGNLSQRVLFMKRRCIPKFNIVLISAACASVFVFFLGFLSVYRYRWRLRYLHKVTVSKWFGFHPITQTSRCKFDAFILYAEEDRDFVLETMLTELETKRGHKLCVEDRDFMPGTFITTNITCAVQSSTLTVPVISPDFLSGEYSEYGVQMALCEMVFEKRSVLHLLLRTPMDYRLLFRDLLLVIRDNKYTEYPPQAELEDENIKNNFWDAFSRVIGHADSQFEPMLDVIG